MCQAMKFVFTKACLGIIDSDRAFLAIGQSDQMKNVIL